MLYIKKRYLCLLMVFAFLRRSDERKTRKAKVHHQPPVLKEYPTAGEYLPSDSQVTVFLRHGENRTYFYWSSVDNTQLSITVMTCASPVHWSLEYRASNFSGEGVARKHERSSSDVDTYTFRSSKGVYIVTLATHRDSFAHLYVSTAVEFPQEALQKTRTHDIRLLKRRRRKRLTVRWDPSLVDPHVTDYCLVVNTRRHYKTLCSAQGDPKTDFQPDSQVVRYFERKEALKKISVEKATPRIMCVGDKTHYTLSNLQQGQDYYFNVFATNRQTNLTYPHGSAHMKFDRHVKPTYLRDGKLTFVNMKKLDGKAVFSYKLGRKSNASLEFYVVPCGGTVDAEVILKYEIFRAKKRIKGFGKIVIEEPRAGVRYQLRITSVNPYELARTSGVKVLATTKPSRVPFPTLPSETVVHEYVSLRKCDSITVGWHSSPDRGGARYCVAVKKGRMPDVGEYKVVDHCSGDAHLKPLADVSYCKDVKHKEGSVITEQIKNLRAGESYIVYVTVKKRRGRSLSYDLLQAHTKPECD